VGAGVVGSLFSGLHEEFRRGCEVRGFKTPRGWVRAVRILQLFRFVIAEPICWHKAAENFKNYVKGM
jgi:hypothetical protein